MMNFAEAAMLIQGSATVYSKKVIFSCSVIFFQSLWKKINCSVRLVLIIIGNLLSITELLNFR